MQRAGKWWCVMSYFLVRKVVLEFILGCLSVGVFYNLNCELCCCGQIGMRKEYWNWFCGKLWSIVQLCSGTKRDALKSVLILGIGKGLGNLKYEVWSMKYEVWSIPSLWVFPGEAQRDLESKMRSSVKWTQILRFVFYFAYLEILHSGNKQPDCREFKK